jgi:hypothetical protein
LDTCKNNNDDFGFAEIGIYELLLISGGVGSLVFVITSFIKTGFANWILSKRLLSLYVPTSILIISIISGIFMSTISSLMITPESKMEVSNKIYQTAAIQAMYYPELKKIYINAMGDGVLTEKEFLSIMKGYEIQISGKLILSTELGKSNN